MIKIATPIVGSIEVSCVFALVVFSASSFKTTKTTPNAINVSAIAEPTLAAFSVPLIAHSAAMMPARTAITPSISATLPIGIFVSFSDVIILANIPKHNMSESSAATEVASLL